MSELETLVFERQALLKYKQAGYGYLPDAIMESNRVIAEYVSQNTVTELGDCSPEAFSKSVYDLAKTCIAVYANDVHKLYNNHMNGIKTSKRKTPKAA